MRFSFLFSVSCALSLSLASCSVDAQPDSSNDLRNDSKISPSDRVSLTDAYAMASIATKGLNKAVEVDPVIDVEGDTLMYFVNYEEGWKILSSDKRTPAVIAESEVGSISLSTENCGLLSWLGMTAEDMKHIIHLEDSKLNFTADQIRSHRQQWQKEPMRFQGDSLPILPHNNEEWELQSVSTSEVFYDSLNHLVAAHWDQLIPYNHFCPPRDDGNGNKPAGCVPVAFGQLLQFLCEHYNIDFTFCWNGLWGDIDDVVPDYTISFEGNNIAPLLLRYLGACLYADYDDDGTSVWLAETKMQNFLSGMFITCSKQDYSVNKVKNNLINGLPILVTGYSDSFLWFPTHGHAYLIDGYKLTRTRTIETYTRLVGYPPILEERYDTTYTSPHINKIKMNWGYWMQWVDQHINDDWFALTGDWYISSDNNTTPDVSYTQSMTILCDFAKDIGV